MAILKINYKLNGEASYTLNFPTKMLHNIGWKELDEIDFWIDPYSHDLLLRNKSLRRVREFKGQ